MNLATWLQNLLPSGPFAISGWVIFLAVISWLVAVALIMSLMKAAARADRWAQTWKGMLRHELDWQKKEANSAGPQVTAKTLVEDRHTNKDIYPLK